MQLTKHWRLIDRPTRETAALELSSLLFHGLIIRDEIAEHAEKMWKLF